MKLNDTVTQEESQTLDKYASVTATYFTNFWFIFEAVLMYALDKNLMALILW
jgi:hypothetical protein